MACKRITIALLLMMQPWLAHGETFNTAQIAARTASIDCLDWKVVGACFWLFCIPKYCKINITLKVQHNLPDLTVVSYPHQSPWHEYRYLNKVTQFVSNPLASDTGGGDIGRQNQSGSAVRFKEVQVIGNPAARFTNIFGAKFLCKSKVKPLHTYFHSADPKNARLWRGGDAAQTERAAWTPGIREIGHWPTNTWGSVYPRSGFIVQSDDPKAGAVTSQRAIDIVTNHGQDFHYTALGQQGHRWEVWGDPSARDAKSCRLAGGLWSPPNPTQGIKEGKCISRRSVQWLPEANEKTDRWQMISPVVNRSCETFGSEGDWSFGKQSEDGNYAFNYWRKYKCCLPGRGIYLYSVEF